MRTTPHSITTIVSVFTLVICSLLFLSCGNDEEVIEEPEIKELKFIEFSGGFECDEIDAEEAIFLYDPINELGWFGWLPSNGGGKTYTMKRVTVDLVDETYLDFYGVDDADIETLSLNFPLNFSNDSTAITSSGILGRASGNQENCALQISQSRESRLIEYIGQFECDEIDADEAVFLYDETAKLGWFGWRPSNSGFGNFTMDLVDGLNFTEEFRKVYGVDKSFVTETVFVTFELTLSSDGLIVTGSGELKREDDSIETCQISFVKAQ